MFPLAPFGASPFGAPPVGAPPAAPWSGAAPGFAPGGRPKLPAPPAAGSPVSAALAAGMTPSPSPKVRLQSDDPPAPPRRIVLPSPEELGVGVAVPASPGAPRLAVDWNVTHERLRQMGALGFHLDRLAAGAVRVTFWLPTAQPGRTHLIEASAPTEAEAVAQALQQAAILAPKR